MTKKKKQVSSQDKQKPKEQPAKAGPEANDNGQPDYGGLPERDIKKNLGWG